MVLEVHTLEMHFLLEVLVKMLKKKSDCVVLENIFENNLCLEIKYIL